MQTGTGAFTAAKRCRGHMGMYGDTHRRGKIMHCSACNTLVTRDEYSACASMVTSDNIAARHLTTFVALRWVNRQCTASWGKWGTQRGGERKCTARPIRSFSEHRHGGSAHNFRTTDSKLAVAAVVGGDVVFTAIPECWKSESNDDGHEASILSNFA